MLFLVALLILGSFLIFFYATDTLDSSDNASEESYGIMIDAGSSGSRIMIYKWPVNKGHGFPILHTSDEFQFKQEPGLSSFASDMDALDEYLKSLFDFASNVIPEKFHSITPVYLYATAGMRLLSLENQTRLLQKSCHFVKKHYLFPIENCFNHFKVISGEMEGVFGWLAVNYLRGSLISNSTYEEISTVGFLDMGGASAQIAFEPTKSMASKHKEDLTTIELVSNDGIITTFHVFVTTWLGFGANQARSRYLEKLLQLNSLEASQITDACLPKGFSQKVDNTVLVGSGDYDTCSKTMVGLLNKDKMCPDLPCYFDGIHIPLLSMKNHYFLGVSEFWYTSHDVFELGGSYDASQMRKATREFCNSNWTDINEDYLAGNYPNVNSVDRLESQCFKSTWIMTILHEGFGLPQEADGKTTKSTFESVNEIQNVGVSWTLGAMLLRISDSQLANIRSSGRMEGVSIIVCFFLILILAIAFYFSVANKSYARVRKLSKPSILRENSTETELPLFLRRSNSQLRRENVSININ